MILRQAAWGMDTAIGTAMGRDFLHPAPLCRRKIIPRRLELLSAAICLTGTELFTSLVEVVGMIGAEIGAFFIDVERIMDAMIHTACVDVSKTIGFLVRLVFLRMIGDRGFSPLTFFQTRFRKIVLSLAVRFASDGRFIGGIMRLSSDAFTRFTVGTTIALLGERILVPVTRRLRLRLAAFCPSLGLRRRMVINHDAYAFPYVVWRALRDVASITERVKSLI